MITALPALTVFLPSLTGRYRRTVPTVSPYRGETGRTVTVTHGTGVPLPCASGHPEWMASLPPVEGKTLAERESAP
jgi:hypothetical protein